jgi:hypothetical protein
MPALAHSAGDQQRKAVAVTRNILLRSPRGITLTSSMTAEITFGSRMHLALLRGTVFQDCQFFPN